MNNPTKKTCVEYNLNESLLSFAFKKWKLPKSNIYIPFIKFSGIINPILFQDQVKFAKYRINEFCDYLYPSAGLIIDMVDMVSENSDLFNAFLNKLVMEKEHMRVILKSHQSINGELTRYVVTEQNNAFSDLIYELKGHRNDGGKMFKKTDIKTIQSVVLEEVDLKNISHLKFKFFICNSEGFEENIYLICISGKYKPGSAGEDDAKFIKWNLMQFVDYIKPNYLIIDLTNFKYEWGDDLNLYPLNYDNNILFILKEKQIESLKNEIFQGDMISSLQTGVQAMIKRLNTK